MEGNLRCKTYTEGFAFDEDLVYHIKRHPPGKEADEIGLNTGSEEYEETSRTFPENEFDDNVQASVKEECCETPTECRLIEKSGSFFSDRTLPFEDDYVEKQQYEINDYRLVKLVETGTTWTHTTTSRDDAFRCMTCIESFSSEKDLELHILIHVTGIKKEQDEINDQVHVGLPTNCIVIPGNIDIPMNSLKEECHETTTDYGMIEDESLSFRKVDQMHAVKNGHNEILSTHVTIKAEEELMYVTSTESFSFDRDLDECVQTCDIKKEQVEIQKEIDFHVDSVITEETKIETSGLPCNETYYERYEEGETYDINNPINVVKEKDSEPVGDIHIDWGLIDESQTEQCNELVFPVTVLQNHIMQLQMETMGTRQQSPKGTFHGDQINILQYKLIPAEMHPTNASVDHTNKTCLPEKLSLLKKQLVPVDVKSHQTVTVNEALRSQDSPLVSLLPSESLYCKVCDKTFSRTSSLNRHQRSCHFKMLQNLSKKKHVPVPILKKILVKEALPTQDSPLVSPLPTSKPFYCQLCNKSFSARCILIKHQRSRQHIKMLQNSSKKELHTCRLKCDTCSDSFKLKRSLKRHINICKLLSHHNKTLTHGCEVCKEKFTSFSLLQQHIAICHSVSVNHIDKACHQQKLSTLEKQLNIKSRQKVTAITKNIFVKEALKHNSPLALQSLVNESLLQPGSRKEFCETCAKSFSAKRNLVRHQETREHIEKLLGCDNDEPNPSRGKQTNGLFKCETCSSSFSSSFSLKMHTGAYNFDQKLPCMSRDRLQKCCALGLQIYCCEICSTEFTSRCKFLTHCNRTHRHSCEVCKEIFTKASLLQQHNTTHHGRENSQPAEIE